MLEEERRSEVSQMLEENRGLATGTIIATALAAAVVAYMLRRARQEEEARAAAAQGGGWGRALDLLGEERLEAGREFVVERVLPEFKPAMLDVLKDLEGMTQRWFRQAEKTIRRL